jgi:preprotein translocase subunit SecE
MSNNATNFFKSVGNEMRKVSWPSKEQLQEATVVTILVCLIFTVLTFVVDLVVKKVLDLIYSLS